LENSVKRNHNLLHSELITQNLSVVAQIVVALSGLLKLPCLKLKGNYMSSIFDQMYRDFVTTTIGADRFLDMHRSIAAATKRIGGFPFYNIKKSGENAWTVELALAGYTLADLNVTLNKNILTISSDGHSPDAADAYLYQGFAFRKFSKSITLMDNVQVDGAELANGILSIWLSEFLRDEDKPKKINIQSPSQKSHPQLLNEDSVI
jgi:molecular chaperone IbpA